MSYLWDKWVLTLSQSYKKEKDMQNRSKIRKWINPKKPDKNVEHSSWYRNSGLFIPDQQWILFIANRVQPGKASANQESIHSRYCILM